VGATFVLLGDIHVSRALPPDAPEIARRFLELTPPDELARFLAEVPERVPEAELVVALGDLTNRGLDEEYERLLGAVAASPLPVVLLAGNHDHMAGSHEAVMSARGHSVNTADPAAFERHVGVRWFAFDHGGIHFAALDWHTWELGLDAEEQEAWLRADLASVPPSTPWVLLSHDQMPAVFCAGLPRPPAAAFSGHWHTTRVVRDGATLHCNTPTPFFGGLDYTPPAFRVVRIDDDGRVGLRTLTRRPGPFERATFAAGPPRVAAAGPVEWTATLDGAAHRAGPVFVDGRVLAVAKDEDTGAGRLEAFDRATGRRLGRVELPATAKARALVAGGVVVVALVTGEVVALDTATLAPRWRFDPPDRLSQWVYLEPVTDGRLVFTGDQTAFRALDLATGALCWERRDLGPHVNDAVQGAPALVGDVLVAGFFPLPVQGLDPATGETRWSPRVNRRDPMAGGILGPSPLGGIAADPSGAAVFIHAIPGAERIDAATGHVSWVVATPGVFNSAAPVVTPLGVVFVAADGDVVLLDADSGAERWRTVVGGGAPLSFAPYTAHPQPLLAEPALAPDGRRLVLPCLDGVVRILDLADGSERAAIDVGAPVAAPPAVDERGAVVVTVDGTVVALRDKGA
jgi:outer membrane protein assembly factor BamB